MANTIVATQRYPNGDLKIIYSTDGINFQDSATYSNLSPNFVVNNGSIILIGCFDTSLLANVILRSTDGSNWSNYYDTTANPDDYHRSIAWNGSTWFTIVQVNNSPSNSAYSSTDGISWTPVTYSNIFSNITYVRGISGLFVGVNDADATSNIIHTSSDGINWTHMTSADATFAQIPSYYQINDLQYNGSIWLATAHSPSINGMYTLTSSDLSSWVLSSNIQSTLIAAPFGIASTSNLWVVAGGSESTNQLAYSSNGSDWTASSSLATLNPGGGITYVNWNGVQWTASGENIDGITQYFYSSDAITWQASPINSDNITNNITYTSYINSFFSSDFGSNAGSNPYTYEEALLAPVPSDPVDKAFYFAALTNNYINSNSSTAISVSNNNLLNYYRNLVPSIPVDTPLFFLPTNSSRVVSQSVISSLSDGNYVLFPDNYSVTISGKTYAISGNSLVITTSGVPATIAPNGTFTVYNKTLRFLTAGSSGVTVVTATASNPPCFLEGTKILCLVDEKEQYITIESLTKGTLVKTLLEGYKPVTHLGYSKMTNSGLATRERNQMYVCRPEKYPTLTEPLYITGCHSILVDDLTERQREETLKVYGRLFDTDDKYRLEAYLDDRASPWSEKGECTVWHVALENNNATWNYGIYANGLLVESISNRSITASKTLSLMF